MKNNWVKRILLAIILLLTSTTKAIASEAEIPEELQNLYAKAACLMDAESGRVLFDKKGEEALPMASTTKIMTLLVTLEQADVSELVTISKTAARQPDVQLNANTGEQYVLKDLLYSLMLESHNDSAVAIAEHVGGSVKGFADLMNQKAEEIGCEHTYFISPNGLDSTDEHGTHATTAIDLARIMSYCITKSEKAKEFLEITQTIDYSFTNKLSKEDGTVANGTRSFSCHNHNAFLTMMEGAISGKTGFTGNAGYCYVGALQREGKTYVVALLACGWPNNKSYKWSDTKKMMTYGIENYDYISFDQIPIKEEKLAPIQVLQGKSDEIGRSVTTDLAIKKEEQEEESKGMLLNKGEEIIVNYTIKDSLEAPVFTGDRVGTIQYILNNEVIKERVVVAANSIQRIDLLWCVKKVFGLFWV